MQTPIDKIVAEIATKRLGIVIPERGPSRAPRPLNSDEVLLALAEAVTAGVGFGAESALKGILEPAPAPPRERPVWHGPRGLGQGSHR